MEVKGKIMYHFHRSNEFDDMWIPDKEIIVDDSFKSIFCNSFEDFSTGIGFKRPDGDSEIRSIDSLMWEVIKDEYENISYTKELFELAYRKIKYASIYMRENSLESYRRDNNPNLPSRYHAIWVTDKNSVNYWKKVISCKPYLCKVLLNGELFKTSDEFLPQDYDSISDMYRKAEMYWNPNFNLCSSNRNEYLFQGSVRVLNRKK